MCERFKLAPVDISNRHAKFTCGCEDFINAFGMSAMSNEDHFELALPRAQGSEDGLSAFKMRHQRTCYR